MTTIIHVSVLHRMAVVTHAGKARLFRLKHINPLELISTYKTRGFKGVWINHHTMLLTKRTATVKGQAA